jgi:8-oxo-dGTP pyrophosphatase MutT (NUDIX family)
MTLTILNIVLSILVVILILIVAFICYTHYKNIKYVPARKWFIKSIEIIPKFAHLEPQMNALIIAPKFLNWINKFNTTQITLISVTITDIDWFAAKPDPLKLGFVKCASEAYDYTTGKRIVSNISFIRGDSVAILIVVNVIDSTGENKPTDYVLLCEQHRLPVGKRMKEICAGMKDAEGNILSVVLKEVEEETGFVIKSIKELIKLGQKIYLSPGGCDEGVELFAWTTTITEDEFTEKQNRMYGCAKENEEIKLSFVEFSNFENQVLPYIGDVKAECAWYRFLNERAFMSRSSKLEA